MKKIALLCSVALLAACNTTGDNVQAQVQQTCANAKPFVDAIQILDDNGELSAKNHTKFGKAKVLINGACAPGAIVNWQSAVVNAALAYTYLRSIKEEEANG